MNKQRKKGKKIHIKNKNILGFGGRFRQTNRL
jgi:hypothetical protein